MMNQIVTELRLHIKENYYKFSSFVHLFCAVYLNGFNVDGLCCNDTVFTGKWHVYPK